MSYPLVKNDAINTLISIREFCILLGYPKILQTDNGGEYKNHIMEDFCEKNNINHIFSSPYHPQTNGVVEVSHKEIRKNLVLFYSKYSDNFNIKNALLEIVDNHNNKIHTTTLFKPNELINNQDEKIYIQVMENINKKLNYNKDNYDDLKEGAHVMIKKNCKKSGKRLIYRKFNLRNDNIIATVLNNYSGGIYIVFPLSL